MYDVVSTSFSKASRSSSSSEDEVIFAGVGILEPQDKNFWSDIIGLTRNQSQICFDLA